MSRDERLARRAARGDRRAFAEIFERYHQALYRFCLAMVGNPQDAQDALQSTMVKALRALPGERREIRLKPWLYRIARNESVETLRRRREGVELGPEQPGEAGIAERAETRERLRALLADLERLPERQRAALVMRELSGLDFEQIAAAFGSSPAVARQTLYEARLSLRQIEEGREMGCAEVMRELSDGDGRVTRRRQIRAHLESCPDCRAFRDEIAARRADLAALAPLPVAVSAGLLGSVLGAKAGGGGGAVGGGLAGSVGAGAGKAVGASAVVKSALAVAAVGVVGVTAADRAHVIHLPIDGGGGAAEESSSHGSATGGAKGGEASGGGSASGAGHRESKSGSAHNGGERRSASSGSRSAHGAAPPGGGYGRSASRRHGAPQGTPGAAAHGQQTAASHKPTHAAPSPPPSAAGGSPSHEPAPPAKSSPPTPPASPAPTPPASPPAAPEHQGGDEAGAAGQPSEAG